MIWLNKLILWYAEKVTLLGIRWAKSLEENDSTRGQAQENLIVLNNLLRKIHKEKEELYNCK